MRGIILKHIVVFLEHWRILRIYIQELELVVKIIRSTLCSLISLKIEVKLS